MLKQYSDAGLVRGKTVGIDAMTLEANAALRSIVRAWLHDSVWARVGPLAWLVVHDTTASEFVLSSSVIQFGMLHPLKPVSPTPAFSASHRLRSILSVFSPPNS